MNQIFNLKRFGRYTWFVLSMNRWYYGILLVLFTIPATVLSLCGVVPELASILIGFVYICLNFMPNIELNKYGGLTRLMTIPSSWFEKLLFECIVRFSGILIPIGLCSIGFAYGLGSPEMFYSEVLSIGRIAMLSALAMSIFLVFNFDSSRKGKTMTGDPIVFPNWPYVFCMSFVFGNIHSLSQFIDKSQTTMIVFFTIAAIEFIAALIWYPKRRLNGLN